MSAVLHSSGVGSSKPPRGLKWRSSTFFIVFTVGAGAFTDLFLYGLIVPVLPFMLKERVGLPDSQMQSTVSNLLAIYAGASCGIDPVVGILSDKFSNSRKIPFVLGLALLMAATILLAVGQSVGVLAFARFLQGASGGVVWTMGLAIVIETVGHENLGTTMGTIFSFVAVAGLVSPSLGGILYASSGYKGVFGLGIGLVGIDFILRVLMIEKKEAVKYEDVPMLRCTDGAEGNVADTEQTPLLPNTSIAHTRFRLAKPTNRITHSLPFLLLLQDPGLLTAIWCSFMQASLLGAFDATIPLVASEQFGFNSLKAGLLFLPLGGADMLLGPVFGWCVDHYGTRLSSVLGFMFLVPTLVLLRLTIDGCLTDTLVNTQHIALYAGLLAANGVGLAIISSPAVVEAGNIVEKYWRANKDVFDQAPYGQLYGITNMVFCLGLTAGPLLAGHLREQIGYGNMNAVLAGACGLTAILAYLAMGRKEEDLRDRDLGED